MHFTPKDREKSDKTWENLNIPTETSVKFLGIHLDQNLTWQQHIDYLSRKLSSTIYAIRRIRSLTNIATSLIAYHPLFASHLRYGISAWGEHLQQT